LGVAIHTAPSIQMTRSLEAETVVLVVRGELDLATAPALCREIEIEAVAGGRLVIDLSGLTGCDTSSLRALVGAIEESEIRMCEIVVAASPGSALDRLLDVTGTREFLRAAPSRSAAVSALG
jgi:anti-sigma B factor antagonist